MWTAGFPEPLTFSLRVARLLARPARRVRRRARQPDARLRDARHRRDGLPAGHHHPPPDHLRPADRPRGGDHAGARSSACAAGTASCGCRARSPAASADPAPSRSPAGATSSPTSASTRPTSRSSRSASTSCSRPPDRRRGCPAGIVAMASADAPMKGIATCSRRSPSCAPSATSSSCSSASRSPGGRTEQLIDRLGIARARRVRQRHHRRRAGRADGLGRGRLRALALRGLLAAGRRADGLRDPAGRQPRRRDPRGGRARRRVRRRSPRATSGELARALEALLDDPERRARMGQAGRQRVLERFTWHAVAEATAAAYAEAIASSTTQPDRATEHRGDRQC